MVIKLIKLQDQHKASLYEFELENRRYFELLVPSRGEDYYNPKLFNIRHAALLEEQANGDAYFYLIVDETDTIMGRINVLIDRKKRTGDIGYRVGEGHVGKGVASEALQLLLAEPIMKGLHQLHAKTTTNNIGSQRVLEKNGFVKSALDNEQFEMNGEHVQFVYYTLRWLF